MKKIAWLLSLILCLLTFFIPPSAQADQIGKKVDQFKVQGGELSHGAYADPEWTLSNGTGERTFTTHVDFEEPYKEPPVVVLSMSGMDVLNDANNRIKVKPINVTEKGFDVEYRTWGDSKIVTIVLNWTVFGGQSRVIPDL